MRLLAAMFTLGVPLLWPLMPIQAEDPYVYDYDQAGFVDAEAGLVWAEFDLVFFNQNPLSYAHNPGVYAAEDYADSPWFIEIYEPLTEDPDPVNDLFTFTNHGLSDNSIVRLDSSGELPTGLQEDVDYYAIVVDQDTFQLSATFDGPAIDFSGTGTGALGQWVDYRIYFEEKRAVASQFTNWRLPTVEEVTDAYQKGLFDAERDYLLYPNIGRWTLDTRGTKAYQFRPSTGEVELVPKTFHNSPLVVRYLNEPPDDGSGNGGGKGKNK